MNRKEGIYLIDKPACWTSFDIVAKVRSTLSVKSVGHTGTLDPFATGLLIVLVGKEYTKKQDEYMGLDKEYDGTLKLGEKSTTGDPEGEITKVESKEYSEEAIGKALSKFIGDIEQSPPIHSAIKIKGERAYKKARRGERFEIPKRKVTIYGIKLLKYKYPYVEFNVKCSSGTYIRTLGEDIARLLGTNGYLTELRRTKIGEYDVGDAKTIESIDK